MVPSNDFKETADKKLKTFSIVIYTTYLKASFSHQLPEEKRKKCLKENYMLRSGMVHMSIIMWMK